jgi:DNA-binding CsgD family transcriptional regulator
VVTERRAAAIERRCATGIDPDTLRSDVLGLLRNVVPIDAAFFATVDPATMVFTSAVSEEPLVEAAGLFLDNEYGSDDVNKFVALATRADPVDSLDRATTGDRTGSRRYTSVMSPLGLGDELRAALVVGGRCWGVMCLHREDGPSGFSDDEVAFVRRLVPHLADGLRRSVLAQSALSSDDVSGPGILVLGPDFEVVSSNAVGERWVDEIPVVIHTAAARAHRGESVTARVRTSSGRWHTVHASALDGQPGGQTAVVIAEASPEQLTSLFLDAHGLTPAQTRVAALVLRGYSTRQIVNELHISSHTVQEHLRAVFDKFGIGSRRELVASLLSPH